MIKYSLFLFCFFIGFNPYAATPSIQEDRPVKETGINIYDPSSVKTEEFPTYKEDVLLYYRAGQSIGRFPESDSSSMYSIGYRRLPSTFFYGVEYSHYLSQDESMTAESIQLALGYRIIWKNRFLPYGVFQFGSVNLADRSGIYENSSGISATLDVGMDVFKYGYLKISTGIRQTNMTFKSKIIPQSSFTDLYTIFGFEF